MQSILSGCCLQKARTRDPLRFLLDPCIDYPPFAKTRRIAAQTIARWRKLVQISLRKPRDGHGVSVFCYPASEKSSQAFLYNTYTLAGNSLPPRQCTQEVLRIKIFRIKTIQRNLCLLYFSMKYLSASATSGERGAFGNVQNEQFP